jgi:hypothetical protein
VWCAVCVANPVSTTPTTARWNSEANLMQVKFSSGGRGGVPNVYQYDSIDAETWNDFMAGRWAENGTATHWFLTAWGGVRV